MNVLFVCSKNRRRSATAETIFAGIEGVNVLSAGTSLDSETPISADLIEWADLILAMESVHRRRILDRFSDLMCEKKIAVLGIRDEYEYGSEELVRRLRHTAAPYLRCD